MAEDNIRQRNSVLLAKIHVTPGVDPVPVEATDAIHAENLRVNPAPNLIQTDEHTGSLDGAGSIVGGMSIPFSFATLLKGSGSVAAAPEAGTLIRACGMAELLQPLFPGAPEAVGTGSTTEEIVLGATASAVDGAYTGMPIQLSGDMTDLTFISAYVGSTKTATVTDTLSGTPALATTLYQILENVLYSPASTAIPTIAGYAHKDGLLWKILDAAGNLGINVDTGGIGRLNFTFRGLFLSKTDIAVPSAPVFDTTRPPVYKNGALVLNRVVSAIAALSVDLNNDLPNPPDPNTVEGFAGAIITRRNITGRVDPQEAKIATRNLFADFRAGTKRIMHARWGAVAGNRVAITIPAALYSGQEDQDRELIAVAGTPFEATGADDGMHLCFW